MTEPATLETDPPIQIIDSSHQSKEQDPITIKLFYSRLSTAIGSKDCQGLHDILQEVGIENGLADLILSEVTEGGNNLLHLAADHWYPAFMKICFPVPNSQGTYCDCLRILLQFCIKHLNHENTQKYLDVENDKGCTPLRLALQKKCSRCIKELIKSGASINLKHSVSNFHMPFVTPKLFNRNPSTVEYMIKSMNSRITQPDCCPSIVIDNEINSTNTDDESEERAEEIQMDFSSIVTGFSRNHRQQNGNNDDEAKREMEFLESILSADYTIQRQIFGHPLVASFAFMKWERARNTFLFLLVFHIVIAVIYTDYVYSVFLTHCPYRRLSEESLPNINGSYNLPICGTGKRIIARSGILFIVTSFLAFLELLKLLQNVMLYFDTWRNIFQVLMILCMYMTVWPIQWTTHQVLRNWQYSAAAFGVFHVWSTLLINVGRIPRLGIYVEMLGKVSINFGYFMMAYAFLLVGFTLAFCVVFPNYAPFATPLRAILQVIVMMSGEVDHTELFYGQDRNNPNHSFSFVEMFHSDSSPNDQLLHPFTAYILYGSFVVLVTIVMTNLLIGLAVDDINGLQQNAGLAQTTRCIANIAYLESLVFSSKLPSTGLIMKLRRSLYLGHIGRESTSPDQKYTTNTLELEHDVIDGKKSLCNRFLGKFCARFRRTRHLKRYYGGKYIFRISLDDCKSRRQFPEDVFFKAVKIADNMGQGQSIRDSLQFQRKISKDPDNHFF